MPRLDVLGDLPVVVAPTLDTGETGFPPWAPSYFEAPRI